MSKRFIIMLSLFVGSSIGSYVPALWGDSSFLSGASVITTFIGGALGIWMGVRISRILG